MANPVIVRPWQFRANALITGTAPTFLAIDLNQNTLWHIKESFKGTGSWTDLQGAAVTPTGNWTVSFSCDSVTAGAPGDGVDHWTAPTNIVTGTGAAVRSWIVLKQPGISPNFEVCYEANPGGGVYYAGTIVISPNSRFGFGGGSVGATNTRPTADDEIVLLNVGNYGGTAVGAAGSNRIHVLKSADGAATRVIIVRNGFVAGVWLLEMPIRQNQSWQHPAIGAVVAVSTDQMASTGLPLASVNNAAVVAARSADYPAGAAFLSYLVVASGGAAVGFAAVAEGVPNDLDGTTPFWPVDIWSRTYGARGRNGTLVDCWFVAPNVADGTNIPDDDSRQFIQVGVFTMPWNRSVAKWY